MHEQTLESPHLSSGLNPSPYVVPRSLPPQKRFEETLALIRTLLVHTSANVDSASMVSSVDFLVDRWTRQMVLPEHEATTVITATFVLKSLWRKDMRLLVARGHSTDSFILNSLFPEQKSVKGFSPVSPSR